MSDGRSVTRREELENELATYLFRSGVSFAKRHYLLTTSYLIGVVLVLFATGLAVTEEQVAQYQATLSKIDLARLDRAEQKVWRAEAVYRETKGWFSCDDECQVNKVNYEKALGELEAIDAEYKSIYSEAKKGVGLFSEYGVQEARDTFWSQFAGGKEFAKRSSWWDLIFMGIGSLGRDESLVEFAIRFLFQLLMNFTLGMIGALIGFYWSLWGLISSYQPSVVFAMVFFSLASIAATSVVASFLLGLYGAAAGSVFVAAKIGAHSAERLQDEARRQQEYLRYHQQQRQHPHAD